MPKENEHAFIVLNDEWRKLEDPNATEIIEQGYPDARKCTVRVRLATNEVDPGKKRGHYGLKTPREFKNGTSTRDEWDPEIDPAMAQEMLASSAIQDRISKRRHYIRVKDSHAPGEERRWSVDELLDVPDQPGKPGSGKRYHGLIVAEVELDHPGEAFTQPSFVSRASEVTTDKRFTNHNLAIADTKTLEFIPHAIAGARNYTHGKGVADMEHVKDATRLKADGTLRVNVPLGKPGRQEDVRVALKMFGAKEIESETDVNEKVVKLKVADRHEAASVVAQLRRHGVNFAGSQLTHPKK